MNTNQRLSSMNKNPKAGPEHQRRAEAFLSNWCNQNVFRDGSSSGDDESENDGNSRSSSESSTSVHEQDEEEDLKIPLGLKLTFSDDIDLYEDEDEFNAISSGLRRSLPNFGISNVPISSSHQGKLKDDQNHEQQGPLRRYHSADYPPSSARDEMSEDDDELSWSFGALQRNVCNSGSSNVRDRLLRVPNISSPHRGNQNHEEQRRTADYLPISLRNAHCITEIESQGGNRQIASRLPWRDRRGVLGKYTGQVNDRKQPHGSGALIYKDGSAKTSIWKNGIPVRFWTPGEVEKKRPQTPRGKDAVAARVGNHRTFLPHLNLGDVGTARDMIILESRQSIDSEIMNSLRMHDFVFILRSDGQWTYAIIADKKDDTIKFVVDTDGQTKILSKKHWFTSMRSVNPDEACCNIARSNASKQSEVACAQKRSGQKKDPKPQQRQSI